VSILFDAQPSVSFAERFSSADPTKRPGGVASNQRLFVLQRAG